MLYLSLSPGAQLLRALTALFYLNNLFGFILCALVFCLHVRSWSYRQLLAATGVEIEPQSSGRAVSALNR